MRMGVLALALTVFLGGCGSIADLAVEQRIYGGVQVDARLVEHPYLPSSQDYFFPLVILGILDLPLSAVVDTVLLPVTIIITSTADPNKPDYVNR
ncbi:MAG TPA: YceK/YidQ family lipoprotein [Planctomycetota bacterium]|nr:YceK/YidQ family lipoprotein [Planctomycetota bacterium]